MSGEVLVDTSSVSSAGRTLREQCEHSASELGYPVACPRWLPKGAHPTALPAGHPCLATRPNSLFVAPGCGAEARNAFLSLEWPADDLVGHLVLLSLPEQMDPIDAIYDPCFGECRSTTATITGATTVGHHRADWVDAPQTSETAFGGHAAVVWTVAGHTYALGFHGTGKRARRLTIVVARSVELVDP